MSLIEQYTQTSNILDPDQLINILSKINNNTEALKELPGYQKDALQLKLDWENTNADLFYSLDAPIIHKLITEIRRKLMPF